MAYFLLPLLLKGSAMVNPVHLSPAQNNTRNLLRILEEQRSENFERLSTGFELNDVTDNPSVYFHTRAMITRTELAKERDIQVKQAENGLRAFVGGLETTQELLEQMEGIITLTISNRGGDRAIATDSFNEVGTQLFHLINDIEYNGPNLLANASSRLKVIFGDERRDFFNISGRNVLGSPLSTGGLFSFGVFSQPAAPSLASTAFALSRFEFNISGLPSFIDSFSQLGIAASFQGIADALQDYIEEARFRLETVEAHFAFHVDLLQQRSDFTANYTKDNDEDITLLTITDQEEEVAISTALRTAHSAAVSTFRISDQSLRLLFQIL